MQKTIDYNALGQALDTTWGRTSTPLTSTMSVKVSIANNQTIKVDFVTIVNFMNHKELNSLKTRYGAEADAAIKATLNDIRKTYKTLTGESITFAEQKNQVISDDIEVINLGVHNPKRTAYYRRKIYFDIK